ncbi:MAG: hypothetical protein OXC93_03125 [Rhodospirillaceae bacterium]|nr:hypothetical protein [Rhodospirillaceae bacterium]
MKYTNRGVLIAGPQRVCIQIRGSGNEAVGTIKARMDDGTWNTLDYGTGLTLRRAGGPNVGNENCGYYSALNEFVIDGTRTRPTNWCSNNRTFDNNGWYGSLTEKQQLRVQVNNDFLKMQRRRFLTHGTTCP